MTENTRLQTLQAAISRLTEQSDGYIEQFAALTQRIGSLQEQFTQHLAESPRRGLSSPVFGHPRQMKVDFPHFSGAEDVSQWIYRVERFFRIYDIPKDQRLDLVAVNLEGRALAWFQMWERLKPMADWLAISTALQMQFGPSHFENSREELLKLKQSTTVNAYFESFNDLAARAYGLYDALLVDCFVGGLHPELKREVKARSPISLLQAVSLAKLFEKKFLPHTQRWHSAVAQTQQPPARPTTALAPKPLTTVSPAQPPPQNPPLLPTPPKPNTMRKLTPMEIQFRREKGICFTCDERYSPSHKCASKHCFLIQTVEEVPTDQDSAIEIPEVDQISPVLAEDRVEPFHLSYNAMAGIPARRSIRFRGLVHGRDIRVLMDGGNSDNFIHPALVRRLAVPVHHSPIFKVEMGNGALLQCEGEVRDLPVSIQDHLLLISAFVLPIASEELVLGDIWLETLDTHLVNYRKKFITFMVGAEMVTLQDTPPLLELPSDLAPDLATILRDYSVVFQVPKGLPPPRVHDHTIPLLPGTLPIKVRPYRYPHSQKAEIEQIVAEMLAEGIIQPSTSPFSSPVLLVKKKGGSWRFCTDYRALNHATIKDSFPMPTVDELLDELFGARFFSKLDLRSGYHQIRVRPGDCFKMAFRTHQGLYEWLVMPFGLTNVPATFQCLMNSIFSEVLRKFVLVFFDDILVYSADWQSHLHHLVYVLRVLKHHSLFAKLSKYSFGKTQVEYLGHVVSLEGVRVDDSKIEAIRSPLTDLLRKEGFVWSPSASDAFVTLKEALTHAPVLALPDFSKPFVLETDASGTGIGGILSQAGHPIAYFLKKLSCTAQKQSVYAREMQAILVAVAKFRHYLLGHRFVIRTDHKSLKELQAQTIQTPEQQTWLAKLLGYDFEIEYKKGSDNQGADGLSRQFFLPPRSLATFSRSYGQIFSTSTPRIYFLRWIFGLAICSTGRVFGFGRTD
ncbi:uncharacterized protein [Arachis hypogaea]|uniref:uncharacterized protein n=1 Tax=Arachis hypogaea TaxID=3818 RepID=UPI000DEC1848|nr:uncharacterized protein LOC112721734 [Arachis hypogaea]